MGSGAAVLAMKGKEGAETVLLWTAEGRVEEGMMGWKDACARGFCEACEDRDEKKADIMCEKSETEGAGTGGHTTCPPPGGAGDAG